MPYSPLHLLLFLVVIGFLVVFVQVGAITVTFEKLGLAPGSAYTLLLCSLFGSAINLPLFSVKADPPQGEDLVTGIGLLRLRATAFTGRTVVAVNVGGCLVPSAFSLYLVAHSALGLVSLVSAVAIVTAVSFLMSRPLAGVGIAMPILVAPATAALAGLLLGGEQSAPLAYIAGTMGVLLGADVLRLGDVRKLGVPVAAIGGAGTFDGIFLTGILAVLLA